MSSLTWCTRGLAQEHLMEMQLGYDSLQKTRTTSSYPIPMPRTWAYMVRRNASPKLFWGEGGGGGDAESFCGGWRDAESFCGGWGDAETR